VNGRFDAVHLAGVTTRAALTRSASRRRCAMSWLVPSLCDVVAGAVAVAAWCRRPCAVLVDGGDGACKSLEHQVCTQSGKPHPIGEEVTATTNNYRCELAT